LREKLAKIEIESQEKCAIQSQKRLEEFKKSLGAEGNFANEQNHFNSNLNKCFVLISYTPLNMSATNNETLYDSYENKVLSGCIYYANRPLADFTKPDTYTSCLIGDTKASYQEYKNFINQRMDLEKE